MRGETGLYERLTLEAFQSGLSWLTILRKRERFRRAFHGFDPERVAGYGLDDVTRLLTDAGIVRNRAKVAAAITNAGAVLRLRDTVDGGLDGLIWSFAPDPGTRPPPRRPGDVPASAPEAVALARQLRRARVRLRRTDDRLRGDAGLRVGRRPPGRVSRPWRGWFARPRRGSRTMTRTSPSTPGTGPDEREHAAARRPGSGRLRWGWGWGWGGQAVAVGGKHLGATAPGFGRLAGSRTPAWLRGLPPAVQVLAIYLVSRLVDFLIIGRVARFQAPERVEQARFRLQRDPLAVGRRLVPAGRRDRVPVHAAGRRHGSRCSRTSGPSTRCSRRPSAR